MQQQQRREEKYWQVTKYTINKTRLICGGLIIVGVYFMQDFISIGVFDPSKALDYLIFFSVLAFALALPLLATRLLFTFEEVSRKYTITHKHDLRIAYQAGILLASVGIVLAFWHIHWLAGLFILASMIFGFIVYTKYTKKLARLDKELTKKGIDNMKELSEPM